MTSKIFISSKRIALVIAILGTVWAYIINIYNIQYLKETKGRTGYNMVLTQDDVSYLSPAENFKRKGIWKDNSEGVSSYIQRPPMMGFINLPLIFIFKHGNMGMQKYVALILHFFALYVFGLMAIGVLGKKPAIFAQLVYALLPCFWGYLFYYLSESITPSLMVFLFYGYLKYQISSHSKWLFFQALLSGILLLTRPQLGIFLLPFFYFLWDYMRMKYPNRWKILAGCMIIGFGGFGLWQIRSISIAKSWGRLHSIYDVTNNTQYRPVHRSFGELFKIWEHNGQRFHGIMTLLWIQGASPDSGLFNGSIIHQQIPNKVFLLHSPDKFDQLFNEYILVSREVHQYENQHTPMHGESIRERSLRLKIDSLTYSLRKQMWKENYLKTPMHSIEFMFSKSQLNLKIFQEKYRGFWWMETLRYLCLLTICFSVVVSFLQIFQFKNKMWFFLALGAIIYLFYLFFIQKINEERYLMPLLPVLFLAAMEWLQNVISSKRK